MTRADEPAAGVAGARLPARLPWIDDNASAWSADKPPYEPAAPLGRDVSADVAIVGGGFTGISSAYHFARRFPNKRIVLLEARSLANGASGRNGGLVLNWVNGVHAGDPERARTIYEATRSGIDLIASIIQEHALDVRFRRDGCLEAFTSRRAADAAAQEVERLAAVGLPLRFLTGAALHERLRARGVVGAVLDPTAGQLDGLDLVRAMRPVVERLGVTIYESTPVLRVEEGAAVRLSTPGGQVRAAAVVLATNAYTPRLGYFGDGICPVHSHVIATERLSPEAWAELGWGPELAGFSDDAARLSYGCMTARGELVFGGGSNAAYGYSFGGSTRFGGSAERSFRAVRARLTAYLPQLAQVQIRHRWTGPVALTLSRVCTMGVRGAHRNVYFALGYSGHGITLANLAGRVLCDVYAGDDARWRGLPFYQQRLLYIPPEPLRWAGYHLYTKLTGRSPRRSLETTEAPR